LPQGVAIGVSLRFTFAERFLKGLLLTGGEDVIVDDDYRVDGLNPVARRNAADVVTIRGELVKRRGGLGQENRGMVGCKFDLILSAVGFLQLSSWTAEDAAQPTRDEPLDHGMLSQLRGYRGCSRIAFLQC
jgi:hypothetical protein